MSTPRRRRLLSAAALSLVVIFTLFLSGLLSPRPTPRYAVTDLGVLPGYAVSRATAVNSKGDVAGSMDPLGGGDTRAYLYQNGRMTSLGALPGGSGSRARGMNSAGDVTGVASLPTGKHAFLYSGGRMRDLGTLPGFQDSTGVGVNDWGEVAINAMSSPMQSGPAQGQVFLYRRGRMTEIRMPPGCSESHALGINNAGQVVGDCLWSARRVGGTSPFLYDSRGEAVGNCFLGLDSFKGFLSMHAGGDNALRRYLDRSSEHAFVYSGGKMQDLNDLIPKDADWILEEAHGINDRGQIVGKGLHFGRERAFLLTPR